MAEMRDVVNPRQVVLVTSRAHMTPRFKAKEEEKDNIITVAWHMPVSFEPPIYAVSIGKTRYSRELISKGKAFVVNFMPYEMLEQVVRCGTISGEHINKFKEAGLEKENADTVDCCRIKNALAYLECEVEQEIEAGDHIIFIGKVLKTGKNREGKRIFQIKHSRFAKL
jgi:flavin reductase (DIM6/NTAB) family NADH-FMN oxidoreductase RutF